VKKNQIDWDNSYILLCPFLWEIKLFVVIIIDYDVLCSSVPQKLTYQQLSAVACASFATRNLSIFNSCPLSPVLFLLHGTWLFSWAVRCRMFFCCYTEPDYFHQLSAVPCASFATRNLNIFTSDPLSPVLLLLHGTWLFSSAVRCRLCFFCNTEQGTSLFLSAVECSSVATRKLIIFSLVEPTRCINVAKEDALVIMSCKARRMVTKYVWKLRTWCCICNYFP